MAIKQDYQVDVGDISWTCSDVAERGVVLVFDTAGSGIGIGDFAGDLTLAASASGKKVAGVLMQDIISIDETTRHRNFHKVEAKTGERIWLMKQGFVVTNKVTGSPTIGDTAYLTANGVVTPTLDVNGGLVATPKVGQFEGLKDADGYVKLRLNLNN